MPVEVSSCGYACAWWSYLCGKRRKGRPGSGRASHRCACAGVWQGGPTARTPAHKRSRSRASRRCAGERAASACPTWRTVAGRFRTRTPSPTPEFCFYDVTLRASPVDRAARKSVRKSRRHILVGSPSLAEALPSRTDLEERPLAVSARKSQT